MCVRPDDCPRTYRGIGLGGRRGEGGHGRREPRPLGGLGLAFAGSLLLWLWLWLLSSYMGERVSERATCVRVCVRLPGGEMRREPDPLPAGSKQRRKTHLRWQLAVGRVAEAIQGCRALGRLQLCAWVVGRASQLVVHKTNQQTHTNTHQHHPRQLTCKMGGRRATPASGTAMRRLPRAESAISLMCLGVRQA